MFTFLCRNSLSTKSTSSSFFVWVTNHTNCTSWKLPLLLVVMQYKLPWLPECFHPYGEIPSRKGKYPMLRTDTKPHQLIKNTKISNSRVSLVFRQFSYRTYWNGLNRVPQKIWTVLVWYLLSGIRILVYSSTGCGKIYLCLEDNRSSFSRVSLKSETKDARP